QQPNSQQPTANRTANSQQQQPTANSNSQAANSQTADSQHQTIGTGVVDAFLHLAALWLVTRDPCVKF
ncbi:uncharacterized protein LOC112559653, partial [Pomacea canaliculata]|uniref:uncharacterized protein LOC112559653 n=1 Tax=Pomacea canaliculata TaxID=400727 RepID=UPI000D730A46